MQIDGLGYHEEETQRRYSFSEMRSGEGARAALEPMVVLSLGSYEASVYPSLKRIYEATLISRCLVITAILVAYYVVKKRYLTVVSSSYQNISSNEENDV